MTIFFLKVSETQETERIGTIKCKFGEDAARFSVTKTTTLEELIAIVEEEWGEGKGLKFEDKDGDWLKMRNNDDVVEVWNQTKMGVVTLKVFSQQNQVNFVILFCFGFVLVLFCFLFTFFFFSLHLQCRSPLPTLLPPIPQVKLHK